MQKYHNSIIDLSGNAVTTATVTVYDAGTLSAASIFEDDETTPLSNPFTVSADNYDNNGRIYFRAANGDYDVKVVNGDNTVWTYGVTLFDFEDATPPFVLNETVDPTVNDDANDGWEVGSLWLNTVTKNAFRAVDVTVGAAVWADTTVTASDLGTMAVQDANAVNIDGGTIDNTIIGATIPAAGNFSTVDIDGGTIDDLTSLSVTGLAELNAKLEVATGIQVGETVTPDWMSGRLYFAIGQGGSISSRDTSGTMSINANIYWDETNGYWTRIADSEAAQYQISSSGHHSFQNAVYGTAGTAISWNICMQIDQAGDLSVKNDAEFLGNVAVTGTVDGRDVSVDGAKLDTIASSANNYVHPSYAGDDASIDTGALTGANVISDLDLNVATDTLGHVTDVNAAVATRVLTLANLGYTGATNANYYTHPSHAGDDFSVDSGALTGATVISDIDINVTTDTQGHVTDANGSIATRVLTAANIGAAATSHNHDASNITSGTLAVARGGTGVTTSTGTGNNVLSGSPALSGNPTAPTQTVGNNSTRLATTAFVLANAGGVGAGEIGQTQLKSTTASQSVSVSSYSEIALTGGSYTMGHFLSSSYTGAPATNRGMHPVGNNDAAYTAKVGLLNFEKTSKTAYVYSRYIQASPPYNLGDGDIPLFVYVLLENGTGKILGTSSAVDPHWAYNGRTLLTPDRIDRITGKKYKNVPEFIANNIDIDLELCSGDATRRNAALDMLHNKVLNEVEITHNYQNKDMNTAPHPWHDMDMTGKTAVLLDPVSNVTLDLYEIHKQCTYSNNDTSSVTGLLENQHILFDNTALNRVNPNGVISIAPRWKNTI